MAWNATPVADGVERLRRWAEEHRGVPPAFGRVRASLQTIAVGATAVRLPLVPELLLPDGAATGAVTAMLGDFGLATAVISSLPDLRGATTVALTVDHLARPPVSGALVATCTATPYAGGAPQHASGEVRDDGGRLLTRLSGWLMATPAEPAGMERIGLVEEPPAAHLLDLLRVPTGSSFDLVGRDALSNAIGSLHGGIAALACSLAAEAALPEQRPLTAGFTFLRPTPREGSVAVRADVLRQGRRTGVVQVTVVGGDGRHLVQAQVVTGSPSPGA
jgi:acyl-coenzyme A thioesterase PaaI-like protein